MRKCFYCDWTSDKPAEESYREYLKHILEKHPNMPTVKTHTQRILDDLNESGS